MSWLSFLRRKRRDAELQHEIESFLTEETADNVARGMSPQEARRQARVKFGNAQTVRELLWAQNSLLRLTHFARDLRYAFRTLSRTPGFSIIAIAVMALCIGAASGPAAASDPATNVVSSSVPGPACANSSMP